MTDSEILKSIIAYYNISTNKFAKFIGISSPQRLYDIINGRNGISKELREIITAKCVEINSTWLYTGKGEMLKTVVGHVAIPTPNVSKLVSIPEDAWQVIKNQAESLKTRDKQIDELITLLKESQKAPSSDGKNRNKEAI